MNARKNICFLEPNAQQLAARTRSLLPKREANFKIISTPTHLEHEQLASPFIEQQN
jgi:hypothetical protein